MTVIYYTDDEGRIMRPSRAPEGMDPLELQEKINEYNKSPAGIKAHAKVLEDGSLEAYLFELATGRAKWRREDIQDILDTLSQATEAVEGLLDAI